MALALGLGSFWLKLHDKRQLTHCLGSIFNHSDVPNISFLIDTSTESIRYKTVQNIAEGDELCIFYGHNLWFEAVGLHASRANTTAMQEPDDGWGGLSRLDDVISEGELPFERLRPPPEEETLETIKTGEYLDLFAFARIMTG